MVGTSWWSQEKAKNLQEIKKRTSNKEQADLELNDELASEAF